MRPHTRAHTTALPFLYGSHVPHCEISVAHPECARLVPPTRQGANLNFKQGQQRNLISVENASEISRLFPNRFRARLPASLSPFLTPARDFEAAAAAMATPSLPPETLHHFPFMLRATRRTDGLHHKLFSPPSLSETPGSSRAADGQRRYVVPRAARLL